MKAIGLDTCVVLRLLVGEPAEQAKRAIEYVKECYFNNITVFVSDIVAAGFTMPYATIIRSPEKML